MEKTLILTNIIGKDATRECYKHPIEDNKCVKIMIDSNNNRNLHKELHNYFVVQSIIKDFIIEYESKLVKTNKGLGLVCELLKDDNGEISKPLPEYLKQASIDKDLKNELDFFVYNLLAHQLYFYDFNLLNFVIQIKNGQKKLKYIDLKSYENNKSWCFLKLECFFCYFAEIIMIRRLKRLYKTLNIDFLSKA